MDPAGSPVHRSSTIRPIALLLGFASLELIALAQSSSTVSRNDFKKTIEQLSAQQRWEEVAHDLDSESATGADLDYYHGIALAQLGRLDEARTVFRDDIHRYPQDKRFPTELAGVAFKQKRYAEAAGWLRRGLRLDPDDPYVNQFLGTIYFLQNNLEAALKYWNRIGKPEIERISPDPPLRVRPSLLDRALAFAPRTTLLLPQLWTSQTRVEELEIFSIARFRLSASENSKFDVLLNLQERNGFGVNKWEALLSTLSGIAYQTVYPAYFNLDRSAVNITGLVRWDAQKRRLEAGLAGPLHQNPKWRYRLGFDLRNENWEIRESFAGASALLGSLNLRKEAATAEINSFNSGRWGWSAGVEFSYRDYRNIFAGTTLTPHLLLTGPQLKQLLTVHYELWRVPERRFTVTSSVSSQLARIWSEPSEGFAKLQGALEAHWYPKSEGDDFETRLRVRAGNLWGDPPFDELYMLGLERDNDLGMRAHVGTHDGRKGSAPLGVRYFLSNSELNKNLYSNGLFMVGIGPFLDSGKITDPSGSLGAKQWLWDTGAQARLRILGVGLTFIYGKDLRTGNNAYYFIAGR